MSDRTGQIIDSFLGYLTMQSMKPDFRTYYRPDTAAVFSCIPIDRLTEFRAWAKARGLRHTYTMFRGPRRKGRTWHGRIGQSICLKKDATHFSVYYRRLLTRNA